jgi:transposase
VLVVDTEGTLLCVLVVAANVGDRRCGEQVLTRLRWQFPQVELVWVDAGFDGDAFAEFVPGLTRFRPEVEVVRADPEQRGFAVHPRRWIVERTIAWTGRERRLSKEYDTLPTSTEAYL